MRSALLTQTLLVIACLCGMTSGQPSEDAPGAASEPLRAASPERLEELAATELRNIANPADIEALDGFVGRYRTTASSRLALALRYELTGMRRSLEDWYAFGDLYPSTPFRPMQLCEAFQLVCEQDRVPVYLDFIRRHPDTIQATAARMRVEELMLEFVSRLDVCPEYDAYLLAFKGSPSCQLVADLARDRVKREQTALIAAREQLIREDEPGWSGLKVERALQTWKAGQAASLVVSFGKYLTNPDEFGGEDVALYRAARLEHAVTELYPRTEAALEIRREARHRELLKKLDELQKALVASVRRLEESLARRLDQLENTLRNGFEQLHQDNEQTRKLIEEGLHKMLDGIRELHRDLVVINENLVNVARETEAMHAALRDGFVRLRQQIRAGGGLVNQLFSVVGNVGAEAIQGLVNNSGNVFEKIGPTALKALATLVGRAIDDATTAEPAIPPRRVLGEIQRRIDLTMSLDGSSDLAARTRSVASVLDVQHGDALPDECVLVFDAYGETGEANRAFLGNLERVQRLWPESLCARVFRQSPRPALAPGIQATMTRLGFDSDSGQDLDDNPVAGNGGKDGLRALIAAAKREDAERLRSAVLMLAPDVLSDGAPGLGDLPVADRTSDLIEWLKQRGTEESHLNLCRYVADHLVAVGEGE